MVEQLKRTLYLPGREFTGTLKFEYLMNHENICIRYENFESMKNSDTSVGNQVILDLFLSVFSIFHRDIILYTNYFRSGLYNKLNVL